MTLHAVSLLVCCLGTVRSESVGQSSSSPNVEFDRYFPSDFPTCKERGVCTDDDVWTPCTGFTEMRLTRGKEWECRDTTEFPDYQMPRVCGPKNSYLPTVISIRQESMDTGSRVTMFPSVISKERIDDSGNVLSKTKKYEMEIHAMVCKGSNVRAVINVTPASPYNPTSYYVEQVSAFLLIALLVVGFLACAAMASDEERRNHRRSNCSSSSGDVLFGYMLGSSRGSTSRVKYE